MTENQLVDLTVQTHVLSDPEQREEQAQFQQERRARSSLSNRNHSSHGKKPIKGPAVSGAIAQTSQIMATAALEANLNVNLNSSQPIIIPSKGQHNLDLNTNLR